MNHEAVVVIKFAPASKELWAKWGIFLKLSKVNFLQSAIPRTLEGSLVEMMMTATAKIMEIDVLIPSKSATVEVEERLMWGIFAVVGR